MSPADIETIRAVVRAELAAASRDVWHNRRSAAEYMRCCVAQISRLDALGKLSGVGEGRLRRWRQSELDRRMGASAS